MSDILPKEKVVKITFEYTGGDKYVLDEAGVALYEAQIAEASDAARREGGHQFSPLPWSKIDANDKIYD